MGKFLLFMTQCEPMQPSKYFKNGFARPLVALWKRYQRSAAHRNIEWKIELAEFSQLVNRCCFYCGGLPQPARHFYHGLDRVLNECCYRVGNVVPCCSPCNYMKGTLTLDAFLQQCGRITARENFIRTDFARLSSECHKLQSQKNVQQLQQDFKIMTVADCDN